MKASGIRFQTFIAIFLLAAIAAASGGCGSSQSNGGGNGKNGGTVLPGEDTLSKLNRAIEDAPGDPVPCFERGKYYYEKGDWNRASKDFSKAVALANNNYPQASAWRARCLYRHAVVDPARRTLAIQRLGEAIELTGGADAGLFDMRGELYLEKDDFDEAAADIDRAAAGGITRPVTQAGRAFIHFRDGDAKKAEAIFAELEKAAELDKRIIYWRGRMRLLEKRWVDAAADFRASIDAGHAAYTAYYYLGAALTETGDYVGAIEAYQVAMRKKPGKERELKRLIEVLEAKERAVEND